MKKLPIVLSLIVAISFGISVQSQVEVSENNSWETSVFKKPKDSANSQSDSPSQQRASQRLLVLEVYLMQDFIQYDAQVLLDSESLVMLEPNPKESSIKQQDFNLRYRQDGLTSGSSGNNIFKYPIALTSLASTEFPRSAVDSQRTATDRKPYDGVGYFIQSNVRFALGWSTQTPFNQSRSLL